MSLPMGVDLPAGQILQILLQGYQEGIEVLSKVLRALSKSRVVWT